MVQCFTDQLIGDLSLFLCSVHYNIHVTTCGCVGEGIQYSILVEDYALKNNWPPTFSLSFLGWDLKPGPENWEVTVCTCDCDLHADIFFIKNKPSM